MNRGIGESFPQIFGTLYVGVGVNVLATVMSLPVWAIVVGTEVRTSWPALLLTGWLLGPALAGAFTVFTGFSEDGSTDVVRSYLAGWRSQFKRSACIGAAGSVLMVVLAVDIAAVWGHPVGALAIPFFSVLIVWTGLAALHAIAALTSDPQLSLVAVAKLAVFLPVRRWYLSAVSLVALGMQLGFITSQPVLALGLTTAPVLYLVWAGATHALALVTASAPGPRPSPQAGTPPLAMAGR